MGRWGGALGLGSDEMLTFCCIGKAGRYPIGMATIKLTSKRQATFPVEVCEALGLEPGDEIELAPRSEDGERIWILRPKHAGRRSWLGSLRRYGRGRDHSLEVIRASVARGRGGN